MKDCTLETAEQLLPVTLCSMKTIDFCLEALFSENELTMSTVVVPGRLIIEEVVGALLAAKRDLLEGLEEDDDNEEYDAPPFEIHPPEYLKED